MKIMEFDVKHLLLQRSKIIGSSENFHGSNVTSLNYIAINLSTKSHKLSEPENLILLNNIYTFVRTKISSYAS